MLNDHVLSRFRPSSERINIFHNLHNVEYLSCLFCAESVKSSNLLIYSTLWSQQLTVGGKAFFHLRGIQCLSGVYQVA